jgi:hypothetical protein
MCRVAVILILLAGPALAEAGYAQFVDVTKAAGLADFFNRQGTTRKDYILETVGGGAAFFDYDNDGWLDILLSRGTDIAGYKKGGEPVCALFRSNRDGTFADVSEKAGVLAKGWGMGVAVADYNDDGYDDFLVTGYGRNFLFRNNGDGTFTETAEKAGLLSPGLWSAGAVFLDYNQDGNLDVYVARYVKFDVNKPIERSARCAYKGLGVYCGPQGFESELHSLFENNGDGSFTDVSEPAGLRRIEGSFHGLGAIAFDYDNDGLTDLYVGNDSSPNILWRNQGDGTFLNTAVELGVAFSSEGMEQASMGADAGDLENRGWLDIYVTNFSGEPNALYRSNGERGFDDVTWTSGVGKVKLPFLSWSTHIVDFDHDQWLDILVINGHVYPEVDTAPVGTSYRQKNLLFRNLRNGKFERLGDQLGPAFQALYTGRGAAVGDYDKDGDTDIVINNMDAGPNLLRNEGTPNRWLQVALAREGRNRNALGARVYVRTGELTQMREVMSVSGYFSSSSRLLHFGLGENQKADQVTVVWPGGKKQVLQDVKADQVLVIREQ